MNIQSGADEERAAIREVLSGNVDGFRVIVDRYQGKVLRLCVSFLENSSEAEDAAQEVFVKAFKALSSFKNESLFSTWLYRVTANHCKDLLRSRSRKKTQSLDAMIEEGGEKAYEVLGAAREEAESHKVLEVLLKELDPDDRAILTLREVQGLSYQEIAEVLGFKMDTVKNRLRRARTELIKKVQAKEKL